MKTAKPRVAVGNLTVDAAFSKDKTNAKAFETLQHRHYAVIAGIIATLNHTPRKDGYFTMREGTADHFANELSANPRFDRARFLRACGVADSIT